MSKTKAGPRVFVPLTKVDEEQRLVYGTITEEVVDQAGEMMDYDKSKGHFKKWSDDIHAASGGLSKGNVRVMHGLTVAGKLTELEFNDEDKSIEVCAKVVDDAEWTKVVEGCYTGFSVGGKYGKKWNAKDEEGKSIKKYEAIPNEVSLVDNPCVKTATFSLVKADGAEEQVMFKVAGEAETVTQEEEAPTPEQTDEVQISNGDVANKATEMAKAANDGSTWIDYVDAAREELTKAAAPSTTAKEKKDDDDKDDEGEEGKEESAAEDAEEKEADDDDDDDVSKVTPAGVKQVWTASDGKNFDKKADAEAHQATLAKTEEPQTEVEKKTDALTKATERLKNLAEGTVEEVETPSIFSIDRIEDLHKAFEELNQPREEDGSPKLEKGMYTVGRFSRLLGEMADLSRTIKAEGKLEGGDKVDSEVASTLITQLGTFGDSFIDYAKQQVAELVAGLDVDLSPRACYDYYYRAAGEDNDLAKSVVEMIEAVENEDVMEEAVEKLAKFASNGGVVIEDTPDTLAKVKTLEAENERLVKVVEDTTSAVEAIEERLKKVEETPLPRAPAGGRLADKGEDSFLGKSVSSNEDKLGILREMLAEHGPEGMATLMIKASHATGGHKLNLKQ